MSSNSSTPSNMFATFLEWMAVRCHLMPELPHPHGARPGASRTETVRHRTIIGCLVMSSSNSTMVAPVTDNLSQFLSTMELSRLRRYLSALSSNRAPRHCVINYPREWVHSSTI
jgi:hypothetical protein